MEGLRSHSLKVGGSGLTHLLLSPYAFRESTKFCWNCTPKTAPPWPAPTPPSSAREHLEARPAGPWEPRLLTLTLP